MSAATVGARVSRDRTILVAGMGTSPAVLTETVWALAHQEQPVVPDEIVVITTKSGKESLRTAVMSGAPSVWERLKAALRKEKIAIDGKLVFGDTSIRVMPDEKGNEIVDLRTGADNLRAADFMLGELRKYTEDAETTILCSIAGGRKTMSALLFSCMTLLGREQDKVYHVLLPPVLEQGVEPPFFFPEPGVTYTAKATGKKYKANKVQSELFEVPFVRMRGWYQEKFKATPPNYKTLISRMQTMAPAAMTCPLLDLNARDGTLRVDGDACELSETCFALLYISLKGVRGIDEQYEMLLKMAGMRFADARKVPNWFSSFQASDRVNEKADGRRPEPSIVSKLATELRSALRSAGCGDETVKMILPKRGKTGERYPAARVSIVGDDFLADILGYP